MKYVTLIITVLALTLFVACGKSEKTETDTPTTEHAQMEQDMKMDNVVYYTCPMESHSHVHHDQPGECELCGMALVAVEKTTPVQAEFYGCPMPEHSHIRSDTSGTCGECGMKLVPLKTTQVD